MSAELNPEMIERFTRVPAVYRFVNQQGQPVPPFGFHFPWEGKPNYCAMCERGPEELRESSEPCDAPGVGRR
jgi:hypothetical protein